MCRECRERFPHRRLQRKPLVIDPDMHHGTCVTHVVMHVEIAYPQRRGKHSLHSRRMRNPQVYVTGKRPMDTHSANYWSFVTGEFASQRDRNAGLWWFFLSLAQNKLLTNSGVVGCEFRLRCVKVKPYRYIFRVESPATRLFVRQLTRQTPNITSLLVLCEGNPPVTRDGNVTTLFV